MKKFIEKHKTKFIMAVCILFTGIITASATTILASSEVSYSNTKSGLTASNVQDAIDELYTVAQLSERIDELEAELDKKTDWETIYPVGSIYTSVSNTNPATLFGGTWTSFGSGRTMVGVDSSQTEFNTVEKTGGSSSHVHGSDGTINGNMGVGIGHLLNNSSSLVFNSFDYIDTGYDKKLPMSGYYWNVSSLKTNVTGQQYLHSYLGVRGKTASASSLQPYITVYMWKRTA